VFDASTMTATEWFTGGFALGSFMCLLSWGVSKLFSIVRAVVPDSGLSDIG